jgi:hypothetical protein
MAIDSKINEISESVIYKALTLNETGQKDKGKSLVNELIEKIDQKRVSSPETDYLKSRGYDFLGVPEKADSLMKSAIAKDYNVYMKVRFNDSYITE